MTDIPTLQERVRGGILGAVVGNALGLPFEGLPQDYLTDNPVEGMTAGGPDDLPAGTWSDDGSMLLSLADTLCSGYSLSRVADAFLEWWREGRWTPCGRAFGWGVTTARAMQRLARGVPALSAGLDAEGANGNGSLMRTLPVALYFAGHTRRMLHTAHEVSRITHAHPRSQMSCGIYCLVAERLLEGLGRRAACEEAMQYASRHYTSEPWQDERQHLEPVLSMSVADFDRYQVPSGGYVVETLQAAIWSLLRGNSFRKALLIAVNLGGDTDTVGCVTGGLAGTYWGISGVPREWMEKLARRDDIEALCRRFARAAERRRAH